MTLIECFTDSHIDNISACLRLRPDTMFMVGSKEKMKLPVKRYAKLLRRRGLDTVITMCDTQGMDIGEICGALGQLIREDREYVIDLTGGDEPVIMAVGAVLAGLKPEQRQRIRVEKYDHALDAVLDCTHDNRRVSSKPVNLTVEELIELHGGTIPQDTYQPPDWCRYKDLAGLWSIVSDAPRDWNQDIAKLNEVESRSESKSRFVLPLSYLHSSIPNFDQKESTVRELLDKLQRRGVIDDRSSRDVLKYTYQNPMLRYCTLKAGNVLEMKTLLEGRSVIESGAAFFQDSRMSVTIDWDGVIHDPAERNPETRNEIDVILMHGTTPLFVSCKNGNIEDIELYKLHTVAARFGGPYARKMLIATDLDLKSSPANRAIEMRAWDMDIFLVTDAAALSHEKWQENFRKAVW